MSKIRQYLLNSFLFEDLKVLIEESINNKSFNDLLALGEYYGALLRYNYSGHYYCEDFFDKIYNKTSLFLKNSEEKLVNNCLEEKQYKKIHIITNAIDSGGHTRLLLKWLEIDNECGVIITKKSTIGFIENLKKFNTDYFILPIDMTEKINRIVSICINKNNIILHIDPDDLVSSLAANYLKDLGKNIYFVNHSDHTFSYFINKANFVYEISSFGYQLSKRTRRVKGIQVYLPIPVWDDRFENKLLIVNPLKNRKIIVTSGSKYKFKPTNELNFPYFCNTILDKFNEVQIKIIGSSGQEIWWATINENNKSRVKFIQNLKHNNYLKTLLECDVYVDSFPVTGGTAFIEALLIGLPVCGIVLPTQGYNIADKLRSRNINKLISRIESILNLNKKIIEEINDTRNQIYKIHGKDNFLSSTKCIYEVPESFKNEIDTKYFENNWKTNNKVILPPVIFFAVLPLTLRIKLIFLLKKGSKFLEKNDLFKYYLIFIYTFFLGKNPYLLIRNFYISSKDYLKKIVNYIQSKN